jgi:hypothetical protein
MKQELANEGIENQPKIDNETKLCENEFFNIEKLNQSNDENQNNGES